MADTDIAVVPNIAKLGRVRRVPKPAHSPKTQNLSPSNRVTQNDISDVLELPHQETEEEMLSNDNTKKPDTDKSRWVVIALALVVIILVVIIVWYVLTQNKEVQKPEAVPIPQHILQPACILPSNIPVYTPPTEPMKPAPMQNTYKQPNKAELEAVLNRMNTISEDAEPELESKLLKPSVKQQELDSKSNLPDLDDMSEVAMRDNNLNDVVKDKPLVADAASIVDKPKNETSDLLIENPNLDTELAENFYQTLEENANLEDDDEENNDETRLTRDNDE